MKSATINEIKKELKTRDPGEVMELCARLMRYKKENKELLTYILFESNDESAFIDGIKEEMDEHFKEMNISNLYLAKKSIRKVLRAINKYIRFSGNPETETDVRIYFCYKIRSLKIDFAKSGALFNLYQMQLKKIGIAIAKMHEDLQYDYKRELEKLNLIK
jgi:hypothetical protein